MVLEIVKVLGITIMLDKEDKGRFAIVATMLDTFGR